MIRILLVEDHALVRHGIRALLEGAGNFEVVGEAADGREALQLVRSQTPDLAIVDVTMPRLNGMEATRQIRSMSPVTRVLILSMHNDPQYVRETMRAGAAGYVLKEAAFKELLTAIQQIMAGKTYLSQALGAISAEDIKRSASMHSSSALDSLTAREREVLQLIAEGNSGTEIARDLGVSARTVESHRERIMAKLDLHSIADLTRFAVRHGICSSD